MALVESRRKAMASSLAEVGQASTSEGLVVSSSKPSEGIGGFVFKTIGGVFGGLGLKTIGGGFTGLGLNTRAEVPMRNGRHVVASGSSRRGEATGEKARWPSDEERKSWTDLHLEGIWVVCFM